MGEEAVKKGRAHKRTATTVVHVLDTVPPLGSGIGARSSKNDVLDLESGPELGKVLRSQPLFGVTPHKKNDSVVSDNGTHYISYSGTQSMTGSPSLKPIHPQGDKSDIIGTDIDISAITALHNQDKPKQFE